MYGLQNIKNFSIDYVQFKKEKEKQRQGNIRKGGKKASL